MTRVSAVLLAAGESQRMGGVNKLTLPVGGVPLLRYSAQVLLASKLHEVIVVLGHEAERARELVGDLAVTIVHNPDYKSGQMTSVHCGIEQLARPCDAIMICLADQPLLAPADIDALIEAFARRRRGSILVPTCRGQRGNPIILAAEHRAAILAGERNLGCKRLIERNPELVEAIETVNEHYVFDLDTPAQYQEWRRRTGEATPAPGASEARPDRA